MRTRALVVPVLFGLVAVVGWGCAGVGPSDDDFPSVVGFEGCKDTRAPAGRSVEACVEYEYDGVSRLSLRHTNTAFNCTPESVGGRVHVLPGRRIEIVEDEYAPTPADCMCLFDVMYEIDGVRPGLYRLAISELYPGEGNEPFDMELDLTEPSTGLRCLPRSGYPWE